MNRAGQFISQSGQLKQYFMTEFEAIHVDILFHKMAPYSEF